MRVLSNATESGRLTFFVIGIVLLNNLSLIYYFNLAVTKLKSILRILLIGQSDCLFLWCSGIAWNVLGAISCPDFG